MKRLLLSLSVVALLGVCGFPAFSQSLEEFEKEHRAYKMKVVAGKENGGTGDAASKNALSAGTPLEGASLPSPLVSPLDKAPESVSPLLRNAVPDGGPGGRSPLGPAANLPLGRQMPATANALNMQSPEEMQAQMAADTEKQKKKNEEALFNEALKQLMPLTPEQIRRLLDAFKDNRESAETPIAMPVPRVVVETISLDPSQTPSVVKTSPGRVTTITILDQTGSPWAIQDVGWAGKFDITPPEEGGHVVRVVPQSAHGVGNISIRLVDMITPVTFTLTTGLDEVYYRFDARIPKQGPLAKTPLIEYGGLNAVTGTDENLVQILDGTPPGRSEQLKIEGVDGRTNVWRVGGRLYLRTPLTLLSPSWNSSVTSADGMNVYTLNDAPVVLLSDEGRMVKAHIAADEGAP